MITAHVESLTTTLEELKPLFRPHYEELALDQDRVPLDPEWSYYYDRDAAGQALCVVLRDGGAVVGYFVGFIAPHPHYRTCLTLTQDLFWLHPDYRDGDSLQGLEAEMLATTLLKTVKAEGVRRGVKRAFFGSKWHKSAALVFDDLGMKPADLYYSAWWGE